MGEDDLTPPPRPARGLYRRIVLAGALIVLMTSGAVATAALLQVKEVVPPVHVDPGLREPGVLEVSRPGRPQTLLLVGSDHRFADGDEPARSDTLMLLRLDPRIGVVTALNIPRDLVVDVPGHGRQKINRAYELGGLALTVKTVTQLLQHKPHHAMAVDFKGFRRVVNYLGCVYVDVDRRYFNDNSGPGPDYATIDVQPGYQRLCGQRALDYVRYRHGDTDLVRAARQQGFVRSLKDQVGTSAILQDRKALAQIFGRSTDADPSLRTTAGVLRLAKLVLFSLKRPLEQVRFPASFAEDDPLTGFGSYVTASDADVLKVRTQFLHPDGAGTRAGREQRRTATRRARAAAPELQDVRRRAEDLVAPLVARRRVGMPLYVPAKLTPRDAFSTTRPMPRAYVLRDRADRPHRAYRIVVVHDEVEGQYYGVQGTTWRRPPFLEGSSETIRRRGRTLRLHFDGRRLRAVSWRTSRGVYWVSNTLSLSLTNAEMTAIAANLTRIGAPR